MKVAIVIPDTPKKCSYGERIVFERLARDLDDDWVVLHSLGLVRHRKKLWGEADFVLLSSKGVFAIEVKGGQVACEDGEWIYSSPGKKPYTKKESPWSQAEGAMFAVKDELEKADPGLRGLLYGYGVIMPHEHFNTTGPEIELQTLQNADNFSRNLGFFIGELQHYWEHEYQRRHGATKRLPSRNEIRRMREILRPDIDSTFSLGSYFNGLEKELLLLTKSQITAARGMANNPRTVIRGKAGTGKTLIAMDYVRRLAKEGHKVLYLCFNRLLARHVEKSLEDEGLSSKIRVKHIHSLFRDVIAEADLLEKLPSDQEESSSDLFGRIFPEVFCEAACSTGLPEYDVLIVDEAQDSLTPQNIDALDLLVDKGIRKGRWHMFLDPMQNIYEKETEEASERMLREAGFAEYELFENCRNTRQVAIQTSIVSGIDMAIQGAPDGPERDCIYYRNKRELVDKLEGCIADLLESDVLPSDIIILSTRRIENSGIAGQASFAGLALADLADCTGDEQGVLHFATMHAFKGLERQVVIVIDLDRVGDEMLSMLHYAGLSRACGLLYLFMPEKERKAYQAQSIAFGRRIVAGTG